MKTVHLIAAARPNFMKIAPLYHALKKTDWCEPKVIYTGQHSDEMADPFKEQLGLPKGHCMFERFPGPTMAAYTELLECVTGKPDATIVPGDVHGAMACALAAAHAGVPVVHLEAGLRSFDRSMPEEINRVVIDAVSDLLWTTEPDADHNLMTEGVPGDQVERIGNIMIDSFEMLRPKILRHAPMGGKRYAVVTLHRPSNVDDEKRLRPIIAQLIRVADQLNVIFVTHPRTRKRLEEFDIDCLNLQMTGPMSYVDFMTFVAHAAIVITDSGGVQEETTYLGIPCLTLRANTERPITLTHGTNELVSPQNLVDVVRDTLRRRGSRPQIPLWDGHAADRAVASLQKFLLARRCNLPLAA